MSDNGQKSRHSKRAGDCPLVGAKRNIDQPLLTNLDLRVHGLAEPQPSVGDANLRRMDNSGVRECGRSSVWLRLPHLPFLRRGCSASSASEWGDRHRAALTLSRQKVEDKAHGDVRFWHKAEMLNALTDIRFHTRRQLRCVAHSRRCLRDQGCAECHHAGGAVMKCPVKERAED